MSDKVRVRVWRPIDVVAIMLASGLSLSILLILIVSAIQVTHGSFPQVKLSDNATQIITTVTGGLTGLLGAYIGLNRGDKKPPKPPE